MVRRIFGIVGCALVVVSLVPAPAHAQFGKLKDKLKQKVDEKVDKKIDCTLEKYIDKKECKDAREKAAREGGDGGEGAKGSGASAAKVAAMKPGQGAWSNFDFVPGARPLFTEDFARDRVGNFPKRLEAVMGTFEIVEWEGKRWLRSSNDGTFSIVFAEALPERWTMEFDVTIPWSGLRIHPGEAVQDLPNDNVLQMITLGVTSRVGNPKSGTEFDPRKFFGTHAFEKCVENCNEADIARSAATFDNAGLMDPVRVRVHADGAYMKVYLNEHRVANMPNMGRWQGNRINFHFRDNHTYGEPLIGAFSINAGGREMYDALMADGRLAVQGIYFDTGKDRIRPESSGTLREIADVMTEHADLNLIVEGHTDNVGDAAANQKLSEARAAAVVAALTAAPYNVAAGRLSSVGLGSAKPARPNETPEGRQANRRVELVVKK